MFIPDSLISSQSASLKVFSGVACKQLLDFRGAGNTLKVRIGVRGYRALSRVVWMVSFP